jgi:hypothetical protein
MKIYKDLQEKKNSRAKCFISAGVRYVPLFVKGLFQYKKVIRQFNKRKSDFTTMKFWTQKLGID